MLPEDDNLIVREGVRAHVTTSAIRGIHGNRDRLRRSCGGLGVAENPYDTYVARTEPTFNGSGVSTGWKGTLSRKNGAASSGSIYVVCAR